MAEQGYQTDFRDFTGGIVNSHADEFIKQNELSDARNYFPDPASGVLIKRQGITDEALNTATLGVTSIFDGLNGNYLTLKNATVDDIYTFNGTLRSSPARLDANQIPDWTTFIGRDIMVNGAAPVFSTNGTTFSTLAGIDVLTKFVATHNNFVFGAGHDKGKLRWANLGVSDVWPATNELIVTNDEQNNIAGLSKFSDVLMVFCSKSFHHVNGFSNVDMSIAYSSYEEGCASHASIVVTPGGIFWWSPVNGLVVSRDGYQVDHPMVRKLQKTLDGLNFGQFINLVHGTYIPQQKCVRYWVPNGLAQTANNLRIDYYYETDAFFLHDGLGCNMSASGMVLVSNVPKHYVGHVANVSGIGGLYEQTGNTDDGTAITSYFETKRESLDAPMSQKRCASIGLHTDLSANATITYGYYLDNDTTVDRSFNIAVTTTNADQDVEIGLNRVWSKMKHRVGDAATTRTKIFGVTNLGYIVPGEWRNRRTAVAATQTTTVLNAATPILNVKSYGAKGDGVTDDTTAIQNALNDLGVAGATTGTSSIVFFPPGVYMHTNLTVGANRTGLILGSSQRAVHLRNTNATADSFTITSTDPVSFRSLTIDGSSGVTKTAGDGLNFKGVSSQFIVEDCQIFGFLNNIYCEVAALYRIRDNYIVTPLANGTGILVEQTSTPDAGDSIIYGNVIDCTATATASCIRQVSSGGLKVIGNKLIGGAYGYEMDLAATTSILIINGNSIENQATAGIRLHTAIASPTSFQGFIISNNQFAATPTNIQVAFTAPATAALLGIFAITGNLFGLSAGGTGINMDGGDKGYIGGNTFVGDGTGTAINLTANATNMDVGPNKYDSVATKLTASAASSGATEFCGPVVLNATGAALATTATKGFTYIPSCAGVPTGVPATLYTGTVPIVYDSTNGFFYAYTGGAWKQSL